MQPEPIYDEVDVEGARKPVDAGILTLENMILQSKTRRACINTFKHTFLV